MKWPPPGVQGAEPPCRRGAGVRNTPQSPQKTVWARTKQRNAGGTRPHSPWIRERVRNTPQSPQKTVWARIKQRNAGGQAPI
jgi:hypothetical protein